MERETQFDDGQRVTDTPYVVRTLLGEGGMGSVYRVEHRELKKAFVLKVLHRHLGSRTDLVARMRNEWSALARLNHPNIVQVTDAGHTACGLPYFVMEYLEGKTLGHLLAEQGKLDFRTIGQVLLQVLDALHAAHSTGAIHRDVKPHNIFLTPGGTVKLLDFGIAKLRDQAAVVVTVGGISIGTPRYMAPEQAEGAPVDGRADVYSVALVLYESLVGHGPFAHIQDPNELVMAHIGQEPDRIDHLDASIPPEVSDLVQRWLSKSVDSRPANASLAARELRALLQAMPSLGAPEDAGSIPLGGRFDASTVGIRRVSEVPDESRRLQSDSVKVGKGSDGLSDASSAVNPLSTTRTYAAGVPLQKETLGWGTHPSGHTTGLRVASKTSRSMTPPPSSSERPPSTPAGRVGWVLLIAAGISFGVAWTMLRVVFPAGAGAKSHRGSVDVSARQHPSKEAASQPRRPPSEARANEKVEKSVPVGSSADQPSKGTTPNEFQSHESMPPPALPSGERAVPNGAAWSATRASAVPRRASRASRKQREKPDTPERTRNEDGRGEEAEPLADFPDSGLW